MIKVSALEPAVRPHTMAISTGELAALIRHHELFNKVLQRELPALAAEHCKDAAQKEGVLRAAAHQLNAHEQRLAALREVMAEALEAGRQLEGPQVFVSETGATAVAYYPDSPPNNTEL